MQMLGALTGECIHKSSPNWTSLKLNMEKEMATHSSVLAWRIPGMGEPGGLPDVYGVAQSQTRLKQLSSSSLEKAQK